MAQTNSDEMAGVVAVTPSLPSGAVVDGNVRVKRATITLAAQASADTILIAKKRAGEAFLYGMIHASATLGSTATIAIGVSGATGKYRAAAVHTATVPTLFGVNASIEEETADEDVIITIAAAALPGAGRLVVDMYFSGT